PDVRRYCFGRPRAIEWQRLQLSVQHERRGPVSTRRRHSISLRRIRLVSSGDRGLPALRSHSPWLQHDGPAGHRPGGRGSLRQRALLFLLHRVWIFRIISQRMVRRASFRRRQWRDRRTHWNPDCHHLSAQWHANTTASRATDFVGSYAFRHRAVSAGPAHRQLGPFRRLGGGLFARPLFCGSPANEFARTQSGLLVWLVRTGRGAGVLRNYVSACWQTNCRMRLGEKRRATWGSLFTHSALLIGEANREIALVCY